MSLEDVFAQPKRGLRWFVGKTQEGAKPDENWVRKNTGISWSSVEDIYWMGSIDAWVIKLRGK